MLETNFGIFYLIQTTNLKCVKLKMILGCVVVVHDYYKLNSFKSKLNACPHLKSCP